MDIIKLLLDKSSFDCVRFIVPVILLQDKYLNPKMKVLHHRYRPKSQGRVTIFELEIDKNIKNSGFAFCSASSRFGPKQFSIGVNSAADNLIFSSIFSLSRALGQYSE